MERIEGPVHGHYLAAYTVASNEGHYGYAKICVRKPECVWETASAVFKVAAGPFNNEASALTRVIDKAAQELREASEWQVLWDFACP
ncbi:hypothetical protein EZ313_02025 [Ramlibacter henchirensis]|jgi:hypothetical protein|uniref:Uncharacterized protein n=1 Tax=Ramlibacter henchirensis TaxID=204072 RepID=A0A4Z0C3Q4_9BURK|nr:hypothetical protein [Ramlibacter henchirensis]TFZ05474.1 hypothetical protein EZ313_02025 [Ramlibacter henchirensis]